MMGLQLIAIPSGVRERLAGVAEYIQGMSDSGRARSVHRRVRRRVADVDYVTDKPLGRREGVVLG